jgi:hypothetical protein
MTSCSFLLGLLLSQHPVPVTQMQEQIIDDSIDSAIMILRHSNQTKKAAKVMTPRHFFPE